MELFGKGAESNVYSVDIFGVPMLAKIRQQKKYRISELDKEIRETRTRKEAKIIYMLGKLGVNAPRLVAIGKFSIYFSKLEGKLLKDFNAPIKDFEKIGRQLALMHKGDIVHGDFTPANIMKCKNDYFVIDFGLSEITRSAEEKAIDLLLMKRHVGPRHYLSFAKGYAKNSKNSKAVFERLAEIEKRGRYQVRTLS